MFPSQKINKKLLPTATGSVQVTVIFPCSCHCTLIGKVFSSGGSECDSRVFTIQEVIKQENRLSVMGDASHVLRAFGKMHIKSGLCGHNGGLCHLIRSPICRRC